MKPSTTPQTEPATDEQFMQAGRYFSDLLRKTVETKDGVQQVLANFGPMIAPQLRPILLRASGQIIVRNANRLDLLTECQAAGIKLWGATPEEANYGKPDNQVQYDIPNLDLEAIFALRDKGELPWNGNKVQQEKWGNGILNVQATLQAILDYHKIHGHVPDPDRYWWLRCCDPYVSVFSLCVRWSPGFGLGVYFVSHVSSSERGGALPREVPSALR